MAAGDPKFFVLSDIVELLEADEQLRTLIGNNIFPIVAPRSTKGDFIAYQRDGIDGIQSSNMGGYALIRYSFFITSVSDDYDRGLSIANRAYEVMIGSHPFGKIRLEDFAETVVDQKFFQSIKFSIV